MVLLVLSAQIYMFLFYEVFLAKIVSNSVVYIRILWWLGKGKLPNSYTIFMVKKLQINLTKKLV